MFEKLLGVAVISLLTIGVAVLFIAALDRGPYRVIEECHDPEFFDLNDYQIASVVCAVTCKNARNENEGLWRCIAGGRGEREEWTSSYYKDGELQERVE